MPAIVSVRDGTRVLAIDGLDPRTGSGPYVPAADNEPERSTFGAGVDSVPLAANPTDILTIQGSASKIIRVKSIIINGISATTGGYPALLIRRNAANTGGTSTALTGYSHDTVDGNPTAVVRYYTANPTSVGNAVGTLHVGRFVAATAANLDRLVWQYSWQNDKSLVLRGATDFLALNLKASALAAATTVDIDLLWTEE